MPGIQPEKSEIPNSTVDASGFPPLGVAAQIVRDRERVSD
jgi:hypothetical protein